MSELQGLQTSLEDFKNVGARVIAVSPNSPEENRGVKDRLGLDFPILSDADLKLAKALGVVHEKGGLQGEDIPRPAVFIVDKGTIRWRAITENWRVRVRGETLLDALEKLKKNS